MKNIFYSFVCLFFSAMLLCGVSVKAQYITFFDHSTEGPVGVSEENLDNGSPLEVGVKYRFTNAGQVFGIHWYQTSGNTGPHTVNLWDNSGANLANSFVANSTGFGWRYLTFASPVTVSTGVTYVASVHMPTGFYSATNAYFPGPDLTRGYGYIVGLATGNPDAAPGNGVYISPGSGFPNTPFNASNYWVDVDYYPTFALPVGLSDLKATTNASDVLVSWKTTSESNNRGFEVQRSNNGADWYALNFVNGAGESIITRNYSYTDKSLAPGSYYYRLKQTDMDGKNTFSAIVTATIIGKGKVSLFQNYPNPFSGLTSIRFDLPKTQHARLSVFDMAGKEVKVLTDKLSVAGSHIVTLDAATLSRQLYIVRLKTENGLLTQKILVK